MLGMHLSRLAEDLILYGSSEFGFVRYGDSFSTGSSMMPQKRNPDALELARGSGARMLGDLVGLLATIKGLPSGYNKDLQEDKRALFDAVDGMLLLLPAVAGSLETLTFNRDTMAAACTSSMMATDLADYLVRKHVSFREAHGAVGALVREAEEKGIELHTFFNVETIDRERKVVQSLEGEEFPYDLLILVPPHHGQRFLIDSGLAPAPGGWLPTDRATLQVGGRPNVYAIGDATDLPLSKAGSTAHFEAPVIAERIAAAVQGREPAGKHADYEGKVMCFFGVGDGKGTLLQFDYAHPPKPPKPNQVWHLGKIVFNKTYWHTVPRGRI